MLSWVWGVLRPQLVPLFPPLPPPQQDIVAEKGRQNDLNANTELHMVDIFNQCRASKLWQRKGDRVKLGRWSSWVNANKYYQGELATLLLVIVYMGAVKGWWKTADDIPILQSSIAFLDTSDDKDAADGSCDEDEEESATLAPPGAAGSSSCRAALSRQHVSAFPKGLARGGAGGDGASSGPAPVNAAAKAAPRSAISSMATIGGDPSRTVKESNWKLKAIRSKSLNTLHFVAQVVSNKFGNMMVCVMDVGLRHFAAYFDTTKTRIKRLGGAQIINEELANFKMADVLCDAFAEFSNPEALSQVGFSHPSNREWLPHGVIMQEAALATSWLQLICSVGNAFFMSGMTLSHTYPGIFVPLASEGPQVKEKCLRQCQEDFGLLTALEANAQANAFAAALLK